MSQLEKLQVNHIKQIQRINLNEQNVSKIFTHENEQTFLKSAQLKHKISHVRMILGIHHKNLRQGSEVKQTMSSRDNQQTLKKHVEVMKKKAELADKYISEARGMNSKKISHHQTINYDQKKKNQAERVYMDYGNSFFPHYSSDSKKKMIKKINYSTIQQKRIQLPKNYLSNPESTSKIQVSKHKIYPSSIFEKNFYHKKVKKFEKPQKILKKKTENEVNKNSIIFPQIRKIDLYSYTRSQSKSKIYECIEK